MLARESWIEINVDALKDNIQVIKSKINKKLIAVIKANGYGCGDATIARATLEAGADMLAVSSLDEALALRSEGIEAEILILGYVAPSFAQTLRDNNISTTVVSASWAKEFCAQDSAGCKVHLKVDTGMNRIGMKEDKEIKEVAQSLVDKGVLVEGMFTHFACAEEEDNASNNLQMERFINAYNEVGMDFKWLHACNSDGCMHFEEHVCSAARAGLAMFGMSDFSTQLKPVMTLKSKVICVKQIKVGEKVGYGWTYTAPKDEWIATIPIGYADGWCRRNQGRMAYLNGEECEFIGRICMDQAMIRVSEGTKVGDIVELFGAHIPVTRVANELDTIPYEVMTSLTDRLTKIYFEKGQPEKVITSRFNH